MQCTKPKEGGQLQLFVHVANTAREAINVAFEQTSHVDFKHLKGIVNISLLGVAWWLTRFNVNSSELSSSPTSQANSSPLLI